MRRKLVRTFAPQSSEAPQFMHLTDVTPAGITKAVDQMAIVGGFDMLIFSFGSGFNLEDNDAAYLAQMAKSIACTSLRFAVFLALQPPRLIELV